ncbi:MAG: hypothetical protein ACPG7F_21165, partial [Aggregatilineales bacterium]
MRRFFVLISILMLASVLQAQDDFPILVGVVTDTSGYDATAGESHLNGLQLGILYAAGVDPMTTGGVDNGLASVQIAGRNIELMVRDYGANNPETALANASEAARD